MTHLWEWMIFISLLILSCIVAPIILYWVTYILRYFGLLDRPHLYKTEQWRPPAPYGAGISILLVLLILSPIIFLYWGFSELLEKRLLIVLTIGSLITLISFVDDMDTIGKSPIKIPPLARLFMQIAVGIVIWLTSIKISYLSNIFGGIIAIDELYTIIKIWSLEMTLYWLPLWVTLFWYVLVFNSINFSDGVPGLTGWFALITFIILGVLALKLLITDETTASQENSRFLLMILAIVIPITLFLTRADISRTVIMWDSGTIMLAFLIATLAIVGWWKIATAISVIGLYVIDLVYVVTKRILAWKNPMHWEQSTHLHFRLMELWLTAHEIRIIVYTLTAIFWVSAILLSGIGKILLLIIIAIITIFLTEILTRVKKK